MLEPYDGKLSRTVLRREGGGNTADPADYAPLVERLHGQVIKISPTSTNYINPMDLNLDYSDDESPLSLKSDFILSLCELIVGGKEGLQPVQKTIIDRCVRLVYQTYLNDPRPENMPVLEDLYNLLREQEEKEAQYIATALEIYVTGSLNVFNHQSNVVIKEHTAPEKRFADLFPSSRETAHEAVGVCPRCGAPVYEGKKGFFCDNRECSFALWKDNRFFSSKKKSITKSVAAALLKEGRISMSGLYSEKTGKTYDAEVILDDTGGKYVNFKLEFPVKKGRRK